ncbi:hypothetical protein GF312_05645 [Candidatus Poribacteria bacterium]|nr:hypothetical protein [Candidatus Poribacteria bacterium]
MQNSSEVRSGFTFRALLIAFASIVIISYWTQHSELVIDSPSFNSIHPSIAAFFTVICICLFINPLLTRIHPRISLTQPELLLIYSMLIVAGPIVSIGGVHFLIPTLIAPFYFATPENEYKLLFHKYIPDWFGPKDPRAIKFFYEGSPDGTVPWMLWIKPLLIWAAFLLAVYFVFLCMNAIIRKQWADMEKLTFPLVHLPLEMTKEPGKGRIFNDFFKNHVMWIGFLVPVIIHGLNGTHNYFPNVPDIRFRYISISRYFTEKPWNAMGNTYISLYPCAIGFAYLLTLDVSFSCGFFYIFSRMENIFGAMVNWGDRSSSSLGQFPFIQNQGAGAFLMITMIGIWTGRRHIWDVLRSTFSDKSGIDDSMEPLSYRFAVIGLILGLTFLLGCCVWAGMDIVPAAIFFLLFCMLSIALTRLRVQAGLGCVHGPLTPQDMMVLGAGSVRLGAGNLTILSHFHFMTEEMRGVISIMPSQLEGFRISESARIKAKQLAVAIMIGIAIAIPFGYHAALRKIYQLGGNLLNNWRIHSMPRQPFRTLGTMLRNPRPTDWVGLQFIGVGSIFTLFLAVMRMRFVWWPFHPIGYAVAFTERTIHWIWAPMLIGWGAKTLALKHGGVRTYRKFLPFFLGLILGDFFMGGFWGVIGLSSNSPGYLIFP